MPSAREIIDDNGTSWWFEHDPPAAISSACQLAVRRWRIKRIGEHLPGLIPEECDIVPTDNSHAHRRTDFSVVLAPLVNARGIGAKSTEDWNPRWKGGLASAVCGGQWTQTRKAAVPDWKIEDSS